MGGALAKRLHEIAVECDIDAELRLDYSGRAMWGKSVAAIVVADLLSLAALLYELGARDEQEDEDQGAEVRRLKADSMGRGIVVY